MFTRGRYYLAAGCIGLGALLRLTLGIGTPSPVAITIPTSLSCPISSVLGLKLAVCATIPASATVTANVKVQGAPVNAKVNGAVQVNTTGTVAKTKATNSNCGCGATTIGLPSLKVDVGAAVNGAVNALGGNSGCGCGSGKSGGLNVQLKVDAKSNTAIKTGGNTGVLLNTNTNLDAALH